MRAFTFKALTQVLKCAGDKKLKEVQLCLEGLLILMSQGPQFPEISYRLLEILKSEIFKIHIDVT